ncbi:MAG: hypothetical protein HQL97_00495 [Magnetococcales bacterium]|nr:hypothetical protein [Magnetococcales bacterium]
MNAPPFTFYCPYCSWRGRFPVIKEVKMVEVSRRSIESPQPAAESGKKKRVISEAHRAAVAAGVRKWHMKKGHKISTERTTMRVTDGHASMEKSGESILIIVTQITPDMPSGSRTATVLIEPAQLQALLAPLGFQPVAA